VDIVIRGLFHDESSVKRTARAITEMYDFERIFIVFRFFIVALRHLS
jgi:hypothetical protein